MFDVYDCNMLSSTQVEESLVTCWVAQVEESLITCWVAQVEESLVTCWVAQVEESRIKLHRDGMDMKCNILKLR